MILIWLSMMEEFDYFKFIKFLKAFNSLENLFNLSKNKFLFRNILIQNNLIISNSLYNRLTDNSFKEITSDVYTNLLKQNIKFISIFSDKYPLELKGSINAPLILFVYGNTNIINSKKKKVYMYTSNIGCVKNNKILSDMYRYILLNKNIINLDLNISKSAVLFKQEDIFSKEYTLKENIKEDNLCFLIPKQGNYKFEMICALCDYLFILNSEFNDEISNMVSLMLDYGKDILVIPGNICNKDFSLSNYLLRDGATVILNKFDLEGIFGK